MKNILITGANKGIGRELSFGMSAKGANIILLGRDSRSLNETYDHIKKNHNTKPLIIECDLESLSQNQATEINNEIIRYYGHLDGLINNLSTKECLEKGTEMSARIIQKVGARLD